MAHDHAHDALPNLAHHFDTNEQQFDSGKLGMWLFLATEVLLFGGLFCAYAVFRFMYPDVFDYAHHYLDKTMGAINTVVLIASSFTMAWAVRCAQTEKRKGLIIGLALTFLGGCGFMTIKFYEYKHKIHDGLLFGTLYDPSKHDPESLPAARAKRLEAEKAKASFNAITLPEKTATGEKVERSQITQAPAGPAGLRAKDDAHPDGHGAASGEAGAKGEGEAKKGDHAAHNKVPVDRPQMVHRFFGIYFLMTGLHGFHVLAGMGIMLWLLARAIRGDFNRHYFAPVDLGGLYWHLVDLIWIYLFPLLYLIT